MVLSFIFILIGLVLLAVGAEALVRGSSSVALRMGVTPLVVGLTVVAFGTGSPELAVSIGSALEGNASLALGNVIGSNISNIALILGIAAMIQPSSLADVRTLDLDVMFGSAILLNVLLGRKFMLDRIEGTLLLIGYGIYIYTLIP